MTHWLYDYSKISFLIEAFPFDQLIYCVSGYLRFSFS